MIEIKNLVKKYQSEKKKEIIALNHINLNFKDHGMVFIIGKSGSGKSTLLHLIGGLDSFEEGDIKVFNRSIKDFKASEMDSYRNFYLGFIFQSYNVISDLTVKENIALALELQKKKANEEEIDKLLTKVNMLEYKDRKPSQLSGGQLQRIAIARALIKKPKIILADEPTGALDYQTSVEIFDLLKSLSKEHLIITVTHANNMAKRYADRIITIDKGQVVADYSRLKNEKQSKDNIQKISDGLLKINNIENITEVEKNQIQKLANNNPLYLAYKKEINLPDDLTVNDNLNTLPYNFENTKNIQEDNNINYQPIKSHLTLKTKLKMGFSTLKHNRIRLGMTFILSILAFSLLGVVSTLSTYDEGSTFASSAQIYQPPTYALKKTLYEKEDNTGLPGKIRIDLSINDLNNINSKFESTIPVYRAHSFNLDQYSLADTSKRNYAYFPEKSFNTVACLPNKDKLAIYNYSLIGEYPKKENEIVISDYTFQMYKQSGILLADGTKLNDLNNYEDIINKKIYTSNTDKTLDKNDTNYTHSYTITGVLKQNIEYTDIKLAFDDEKVDANPLDLSKNSILKEYIKTGVSFTTFVSNEFINNKLSNYYLPGFNKNNPLYSILVPTISTKTMNTLFDFTRTYFKTDKNDSSNYKRYVIDSTLTNDIIGEKFETNITSLTKIAMYIAVSLGIISVLITTNYLYTSVSFKSREIGVLKALGATSLDVFEIFALEALIIGAVNFVISTILTYYLTGIVNTALMNLLAVPLGIIFFSYIQILIIFALAFILSLLSSFIPSYSIASLKPVKAMKLDD